MCCIVKGSQSQDRQEFLKPLTDKVFTEDLPTRWPLGSPVLITVGEWLG